MPPIHLKYFRVQEHLSKLAQFTNLREFTICFFLFCLLVRFLPGTLSGNSVPSYSFYDDSKVDISNYLDDYRDRNEKLSDIIDQRNLENRQNKVIVGNKRHPVKDKYLIVMYTQVFGQDKFCDSARQDVRMERCRVWLQRADDFCFFFLAGLAGVPLQELQIWVRKVKSARRRCSFVFRAWS